MTRAGSTLVRLTGSGTQTGGLVEQLLMLTKIDALLTELPSARLVAPIENATKPPSPLCVKTPALPVDESPEGAVNELGIVGCILGLHNRAPY